MKNSGRTFTWRKEIGDAKYREAYGLSMHEAAAFCIGRRFFGCGEKLQVPIMVRVGRPRERVHNSWQFKYQMIPDMD